MASRLACVACVFLLALTSQLRAAEGDWPQWRGPNRDGISQEKGLLKEWPKEGPTLLWSTDNVGAAYSSIAVVGNRIYTQGDLNGVEHVICLDAKDGKTIWAVQPGPLADALKARVATEMKQLDKNNDGVVSDAEALSRFNWDWNRSDRKSDKANEALADKRAAEVFELLDKSKDGRITYDEAAGWMRDQFDRFDAADAKANADDLAKERTAEYMKLDADSDGKVSRKEARNTMLDRRWDRFDERDATTNKGDEQLTATEIEAGLKKHDAGRDGWVGPTELRDYYRKANLQGDGVLSADELASMIGGYRNGMGDGPRATPTVEGDVLYIEGGNGDVACLKAATGETVWHVNLRADFGGGVPGWGYSESPLIVGDLLFVTPGGKAGTLVALNKKSGKVVWQTKEVTEGAHYSSPVLAEIAGVKQIVQFANQSVFGVALEDGKLLWQYKAPANGTANCCDPIIYNDHVFASSAYGTGGGLVKVLPSGSVQSADEIYFKKQMECHHGGMVRIGDYIYTAGGSSLTCMKFADGEVAWKARGAGKGALIVADGMLYILGENHEVVLAECTPEAYKEHGRFKLKEHGRPAWAHPVVAGGRLYLRDQESLSVYDIKAK